MSGRATPRRTPGWAAVASLLPQLLATLLLLAQPGLHLGHTDLLLASALRNRAVHAGASPHAQHTTMAAGPQAAAVVQPAPHHDPGQVRHDCTCCLPTTPDLPRAVELPFAAPVRAPPATRDLVHVRAARVVSTARGPPHSSATA